jgi:hypothetical protein
MSDVEHKEAARLSRQQAAERLVAIAYALTAGGRLELELELGLELSWSTPED